VRRLLQRKSHHANDFNEPRSAVNDSFVGFAAGTVMLHVRTAATRRPIASSPFAMEILPARTHIPR
jgi:hypothetical protein